MIGSTACKSCGTVTADCAILGGTEFRCFSALRDTCSTVKTRINGPCARTLGLPLQVRSVFFYFFFCLGGRVFWCVSPPFPEEEISDYIAHGPFVRVFTVPQLLRVCHVSAALPLPESLNQPHSLTLLGTPPHNRHPPYGPSFFV